MKKYLAVIALVVGLVGVGFYACSTTGSQHGVKALEQMTQPEFDRWELYIQLSTHIAAQRLLQEKVVSEDDLKKIADVVDGVSTAPVESGATSLIMPALAKAGFTNDEVKLILLVAEDELISRGALKWLDPTTGVTSLSPRTKQVLGLVSGVLRTTHATDQ